MRRWRACARLRGCDFTRYEPAFCLQCNASMHTLREQIARGKGELFCSGIPWQSNRLDGANVGRTHLMVIQHTQGISHIHFLVRIGFYLRELCAVDCLRMSQRMP